jgi:hypothetical protein
MGGVFSQGEGFGSVTELLPGVAFHTVSMALGAYLVARPGRQVAAA